MNRFKFICIIILFFTFCQTGMNAQKNTKKKWKVIKISKMEKKIREDKFNQLKKIIFVKLKKSNSLIAIKDHLSSNFYYSNDFDKEFAPDGIHDDGFNYNGDIKNLEKINSKINIRIILFLLQSGESSIGTGTASISTERSLKYPEKYPVLDFDYDKNESQWKLSAIRFASG